MSEIGLPGLNSSQVTEPLSGLKAIWHSLSPGPLPVVSVSRKMNLLGCEASLGLSVTLMDYLWEVPLLADQAINLLIEGNCKPQLSDARHCASYLNGLLKIEQWKLKGDGLPNGNLS